MGEKPQRWKPEFSGQGQKNTKALYPSSDNQYEGYFRSRFFGSPPAVSGRLRSYETP